MNLETRSDDARYAAVRDRDPSAAGFFFAVRTTGVYCRPACASRTPLRENVAFFETSRDAERAGFRPCKRCRPGDPAPTQPLAEAIDAACRTIDAADRAPSLADLAARAGASPFHFQRAFTKRVGISPKQYALALRERRLESRLRAANTVAEAALDAGFDSPGALYDAAGIASAMTPRTFRAGGRGERIAYATARTSLGWILVARTARGVCAIDLDDDRAALVARVRERFHAADLIADDRALANEVRFAAETVDGRAPAIDVPLDVRGTAFQRRVWRALRAIPRGETRTYAQVAVALGDPSAARAVANACAANGLAVVVPCHRVVRTDGDPGGYRWSPERKRTLLERERAPAAKP